MKKRTHYTTEAVRGPNGRLKSKTLTCDMCHIDYPPSQIWLDDEPISTSPTGNPLCVLCQIQTVAAEGYEPNIHIILGLNTAGRHPPGTGNKYQSFKGGPIHIGCPCNHSSLLLDEDSTLLIGHVIKREDA